MPRNVSKTEINSETLREDLELCAIAAERPSDPDTQRAAARARAELWRREQQAWAERFNAESKERVNGQRFQEAQVTRQIEAQENLIGPQLEVAREQAEAARGAAQAARLSAWTAVLLAILTAVLAAIAAINLFRA